MLNLRNRESAVSVTLSLCAARAMRPRAGPRARCAQRRSAVGDIYDIIPVPSVRIFGVRGCVCADAATQCMCALRQSVSQTVSSRTCALYTYTIVPCGNKNIIPEERIEKRGREGLDGRVCGPLVAGTRERACVGVRSVCLLHVSGIWRDDSMANEW